MRTSITSPARIALLSLLALLAALIAAGCAVDQPADPDPADGITDVASEADADDTYWAGQEIAADGDGDGVATFSRHHQLRCSNRVCPREANACCLGECVVMPAGARCLSPNNPNGPSSAE